MAHPLIVRYTDDGTWLAYTRESRTGLVVLVESETKQPAVKAARQRRRDSLLDLYIIILKRDGSVQEVVGTIPSSHETWVYKRSEIGQVAIGKWTLFIGSAIDAQVEVEGYDTKEEAKTQERKLRRFRE